MIAALLPIIGQVLDRVIPDTEAREKAKAEATAQILTAFQEQDKGQIEINKIEAGSTDRFVSGWRPFIGWVCGTALAYTYIGQPLLAWVLLLTGANATPPSIVGDNLMELVFAMLGLGGLRTFEKVKGVTK